MATQIKDGVHYPARKATEAETLAIQKITDLKTKLKEIYTSLDEEMLKLEREVAIVADVKEEDDVVSKTILVGTPRGHFVTYKEVDFVMNSKTTKKLLKEIEG
jgi:hypothetical protein